MAQKIYNPTRMCVSCREKFAQKNLLRLRCKNGALSLFEGVGRSFYFCKICLDDDKRVAKVLMRTCRSGNKDELINKLKEIVTNE